MTANEKTEAAKLNNDNRTQSPASKRIKGNIGEDVAAGYLTWNGYQIRERNYYSAFGEVDIIAEQGDVLVFVEVKFRKENYLEAFSSVGSDKKKKLIRTALSYLQNNPQESERASRFDVVAVVETSITDEYQVNHINSAFTLDEVEHDLWKEESV